jgi:hypothetical protein
MARDMPSASAAVPLNVRNDAGEAGLHGSRMRGEREALPAKVRGFRGQSSARAV